MVINFPLRNVFAVPIGSERLCLHSHWIPGTFWLPFLFLLWPTDHWSMCCSASNYLCNFFLLHLMLSSSFISLWSDTIQEVISIFLYSFRLALCPKPRQYWAKRPKPHVPPHMQIIDLKQIQQYY
jgi:hypothetical protein